MSSDRLFRVLLLALIALLAGFAPANAAKMSPEEEMTAFVRTMYPGDRIQVVFSQLPARFKEGVKIKNVSFSKVPNASGDGICLVGIEGRNGAESSVYVPFKVLVERTLFATRHNIRKGETLSLADLAEKPTYLRGSAAPYPDCIEDVVGKAAKKDLPPGEIITRQVLEEQVTISKGENVSIVFEDKRIIVQAKGTALEKGKMGDVIRIKSTSGREVMGRVTGETSVSVGF